MCKKYQNVTDYPNNNTIFSVWVLRENTNYVSVFKELCALVINLNNSAAVRFPNDQASIVLGIGYQAWKKLNLPEPLPKELKDFVEIKGAKYTAISTPGDLHFHIRAREKSLCYDMATEIAKVLKPVADCIVNIEGFKYWDGRSILGFVDGTENPKGEDRVRFGVVGEEDPMYTGGSYLFAQKYLHNMFAWNDLSIEEQEKVIGRSKQNDVEMSDDVKPDNSHIALTNIEDENGEELKIIRENMPFGNPSTQEVGTYFLAYASTFSTTEHMLKHMFIGEPEGNYDRILDFSTPVTGTLFFVPSLDMLEEFAE
ncbi:Dyp-type peroxidase [Ornithobacterium rhinotracheale]|uniref:Dyp-type peroxidase n=1 Tax=Ornithobacterium rhinotracheale TaxID=28251 RepID=A0A3R6AUC0_ORNRH|nr:Dyp-type peroxidase [Ornithobacterium rhinotracheale]QAR30721.1 Dyp-type peroxidase [Ornithobacterium rhinotracheale]